jgi:hypothetical protein
MRSAQETKKKGRKAQPKEKQKRSIKKGWKPTNAWQP